MGLFEKLQAKLELYKLEQRYTKRKRRTTFISDAHYVDGEYVYGYEPPSPTSTKPGFRVATWGTGSRSSTRS